MTDADSYQASLQDALNLLVIRPHAFRARLTWVELPSLRMIGANEASPRVARVSLPPEQVFVTFPTCRPSMLICDGAELRFGDIMFHSRGERFYQRTATASRWGAVSLTPASLMVFSRTIAGRDLVAPPAGRILRPSRADRMLLLRLHARVGRIAETNLNRLEHPKVVHALEQDLVLALVTCLTTGEPQDDPTRRESHGRIVPQFEAALATNPDRPLHIAAICSLIGVSEASLRCVCLKSLGMSPARYQRLRRLKLVHAELLGAVPSTLNLADVAKRHGFTSLHQLVAEYLDAYGEALPLQSPGPRDRPA